jgi:hypothetical protein
LSVFYDRWRESQARGSILRPVVGLVVFLSALAFGLWGPDPAFWVMLVILAGVRSAGELRALDDPGGQDYPSDDFLGALTGSTSVAASTPSSPRYMVTPVRTLQARRPLPRDLRVKDLTGGQEVVTAIPS